MSRARSRTASAERFVLGGPVADPGDVRDPAPAHVVEHRDVLRQLHRVVQRHEQRGDADRDRACVRAAIADAMTSGDGR